MMGIYGVGGMQEDRDLTALQDGIWAWLALAVWDGMGYPLSGLELELGILCFLYLVGE